METSKSKLVNSEFCQNCARCCKEYTWVGSPDEALRFKWCLGANIKTKKADFLNKDGLPLFNMTLLLPCKKLGRHASGKYYCKVWGKKRPDFCRTYPDHVFIDAYTRNKNKEFLEEVRKAESENCPALKKITIQEIISLCEYSKSLER